MQDSTDPSLSSSYFANPNTNANTDTDTNSNTNTNTKTHTHTNRARPNNGNITLYLLQDGTDHWLSSSYFANLRIERRCGLCVSPSTGGGGGVTSGGGGGVTSGGGGVRYRHCAAEAFTTTGRRHCRDLPDYCDCSGCQCLDIPSAKADTDGE